jgi:hypothetical protein
VPAIAVCRKGKWGKPGLLVEGKSEAAPLFAWCEGEKLHLLLMSPGEKECHHLRYDPEGARWERIGQLPFAPSQYEPIRQVGKTVHIACCSGRYVHYFYFDGATWSKPVRIEESENRTNLVTRARLAMGRDGAAHIAWWTATEEKQESIHGYVVVKGTKVESRSIRFVHRDAFDLGIDAEGRVVLAYQANLPENHPDAEKVHVRKGDGKTWTEPEKIAGGWEKLFGEIRVVTGSEKTLVSWLAREETRSGDGILVHSVRRIALTDGKSWSSPMPLGIGTDGLFGRSSVPVGPIWLSTCVDKQGSVHAVWGTAGAFHCVTANLGTARK